MPEKRGQLMDAAVILSADVGKSAACNAFDIPRASFYRHCNGNDQPRTDRPAPPLALSADERNQVLTLLHSEPFQDKAPYQVYNSLLDQGRYLCSISTMYRILKNCHGDVKQRRRHVCHHHYKKPQLLATAPNQVWSWDITKLKTEAKWKYLHLYVIIDIFSRYVVGWMVALREHASLAKQLIAQSCAKHNIEPGQLTIHADRGPSMTSKTVAQLMVDLGVARTHNRPYVSNDNPFSESHFKTLKYCPQFPEYFGSIEDSRVFCRTFFNYYNTEHYHSGIAFMTPESLHLGTAPVVRQNRQIVLCAAFNQNPNRFKGKLPNPPALPDAVWINKPD